MRGPHLERPPRWGIVLLVALVAANIGVLGYLGFRTQTTAEAPTSSRPAAATTAAGTTAAGTSSPGTGTLPTSASETAATSVLAVYGDGYAAGNEQGGLGDAGWPALVAARTGMTLSLHAVTQVGYATPGTTGQDLPQVAAAEPVPDAAVTILFGSRNDRFADQALVQANVAQTIAAVRSAAPETALLVIGPVWDDAAPPTGVLQARDGVRAAAEAAPGVVFVDPLQDGWFADGAGLISADGVSPTDAGHDYLAGLIEPVVAAALDPA